MELNKYKLQNNYRKVPGESATASGRQRGVDSLGDIIARSTEPDWGTTQNVRLEVTPQPKMYVCTQ